MIHRSRGFDGMQRTPTLPMFRTRCVEEQSSHSSVSAEGHMHALGEPAALQHRHVSADSRARLLKPSIAGCIQYGFLSSAKSSFYPRESPLPMHRLDHSRTRALANRLGALGAH